MINTLEASVKEVFIHYIPTTEEENLILSDHSIPIHDTKLESSLISYFFKNFKIPDFHAFDLSPEKDNTLYSIAKAIFEGPENMLEHTKSVANHLKNTSFHPNIKAGELICAFVPNVLVEDEMLDAICFFKTESRNTFLKLEKIDSNYTLDALEGIPLSKIDKACIIFNTEQSTGYKICALDNSNKEKSAQFWMQNFLNVKAHQDDFQNTTAYIKATKGFIKDRMKPMFDTDKRDEVGVLQRTKSYLEQEERFDQKDFAESIFKDQEVIDEFLDYKSEYENLNNRELPQSFSVNKTALKSHSKIFKSVLKLDKNFHVYIHGNRQMIERGRDEDGRKFYKLFYDVEN